MKTPHEKNDTSIDQAITHSLRVLYAKNRPLAPPDFLEKLNARIDQSSQPKSSLTSKWLASLMAHRISWISSAVVMSAVVLGVTLFVNPVSEETQGAFVEMVNSESDVFIQVIPETDMVVVWVTGIEEKGERS